MTSGATVSVLMPTYGQRDFVARALESLLAQTFGDWQLLVVDDASPDDTAEVVATYLGDARITYVRLDENRGLGAALNHGLDHSEPPLVSYLPSDDVYYPGHLAQLVTRLEADPDAILAFSGVKYEYRVPGKGVLLDGTGPGQIAGYPLQLVQVVHRRTVDRWVERSELTTDDLDRMLWSKLAERGRFVGTGEVTCEWVDHPLQRHKVVREPLGGVNPYRRRYRVREPLRFHSSVGNPIDEVEHYRRFRERPDTPSAPDGLKIVLCGELAFNPERVLAFEERGHTLYGLWTDAGHWFNAVGPVPFGHVEELPREGWREALRELDPDVIYALLNWEAVPFAHEVMLAAPEVPYVWHFKEGPFDCIANGTWPLLAELVSRSTGRGFSSPVMRDWFATALPGAADGASFVLDGDLPKREWFVAERSPRLSERDGEIHTVVPGGPIGLEPELVGRLASAGIHLHFYGDFHQGQWLDWIERVRERAGRRFHLHRQVDHERWVSEFSQYDAGWLHLIPSHNRGELWRASWGDLNYPARIPTLVAAGVPLIQLDNGGSRVAAQSLARERGIGLFLREPETLARELADADRMAELRENVWRQREEFTFDHHVDGLIDFFHRLARGGREVSSARGNERVGGEAPRKTFPSS